MLPLAILFCSLGCTAKEQAILLGDSNELTLISETVNNYFVGRRNADIELLKRTFSGNAQLSTLSKFDTLQTILLEDYFTVVLEQGPLSVSTRIDSIKRDNNMAFAKVTFRYIDKSYVDYLTLLKSKKGWRIVNKSFLPVKK